MSVADSVSPRRSLFSSLSYSSTSSRTSVTSTASTSVPGASAPTDPIPRDGTSRPSDVIINRLNEVKRITKSLALYFEGLSTAHAAHSASLLKLSAPTVIQTALPESSLFLPVPPKDKPMQQGGWAEILVQIRDENKATADEHGELAKKLTKDVVTPLKKLRTDIKSHIAAMEKEVNKLAEAVLKERETSVVHLSHLSRALHPPPTPTGLVSPGLTATANDDPFIHCIVVEQQLRIQTAKENELLAVVQSWQDKSEKLEKEIFTKVNEAWRVWESSNSNMLLGNQQRSVLLSANVDSIAPESEWTHFSKLNYLIPKDVGPADVDNVEHPHRNDPMTIAVRSGVLERQKRFVKTWKTAFFILSPSGNLHEYANSASPLDKPLASLHLPLCTLGPMPTPETTNTKGKQLEAMFTIENPESRNVFRAKSWEELMAWWVEIEKFTKINTPPPMNEATPVEGDGDLGEALKAEREVKSEDGVPPPLPPRAESPVSPSPIPIDLPSATDLEPVEADISTHDHSPSITRSPLMLSTTSNTPPPASPPIPIGVTSPPILTEEPDSPSLGAGAGAGGDIGSGVEGLAIKDGDVPVEDLDKEKE